MRWFPTAALSLATTLGAIIGPIVAAAVLAVAAPSEVYGRNNEAAKLVEVYRSRLRPFLLFLTIARPENGSECGYNSETIFPRGLYAFKDMRKTGQYNDYVGYYALHTWSGNSSDDRWIANMTIALDERLSSFEAGFLRRCIESTVASTMCMSRVERLGRSVPRSELEGMDYPLPYGQGWGFEDRVICSFVDGVAARKGLPLSRRADQGAARPER